MYALLTTHRGRLHAELVRSGALSRNAKGVVSIADADNKLSCRVSARIFELVKADTTEQDKLEGQRAGQALELACEHFIKSTFQALDHLRPGAWEIRGASSDGIAEFEQYAHLAQLEALAKHNDVLAGALGTDYVIKPDVVIARRPEPDERINERQPVVDSVNARLASLRAVNGSALLLHASVSTKWTLRSDRAQNARTEALNLLRNRKGRVPHIVVVTGEPLPSRIASLALGTGDIDCVYHVFLNELKTALEELAAEGVGEDAFELLRVMINGKRLKDISDLPLDLAV